MKDKTVKLITTTGGRLAFALCSGAAYYILLLRVLIAWSNGSVLLAGYAAPLIICGAAIIIVKLIKDAQENENDTAIFRLFIVHLLLFIISIISLISMFV